MHILFLLSTFCFPPILSGGGIAVRPVFILLILLLLPAVYNSLVQPFLRVFILIPFWALVSSFYGYFNLNVPVVSGDFFEVVRLLFPCVIVFVGWKFSSVVNFERWVGLFLVCIAIVGWLQYLNIDHGFLARVYAADSQIDAVLGAGMDYKRVVFTLANPNDAGMFFCFLSIYFCSLYVAEKKLEYFFFLLVSISSLVLTQSKTSLLCVLVGILFLLLLNKKLLVLISLMVFIVLSFFTLGDKLVYVWNFWSAVNDNGFADVHVFSARLENAIDAVSLWRRSYFFGWGVAKELHPTVVDVEYALILRRYGFIGLFLFFLSFVSVFLQAFNSPRENNKIWGYSCFFMSGCFVIPIFMISNNFMNSYYNYFFFLFVYGYFVKIKNVDVFVKGN